ncbi:MAG TPA: hypothetical protein VKU02_28855 [Gemmataceae bacterium]|nr:hypothetical protein [Gemmataceae bacterium]
MQSARFVFAALFLVVLFGLAGCGDGSMAEVNGTVKVDGQPIEEGTIRFAPVDGKTQTAGGFIKSGHYSVKVPVGVMKVAVSKEKTVGYKALYNTPDSPKMPVKKEALPARYNEQTELQLDVKPGTNAKDWELKSN